MERQISEKFCIGSHMYNTVEGNNGCHGNCAFCMGRIPQCEAPDEIIGPCQGFLRSDGKDIHFELVTE